MHFRLTGLFVAATALLVLASQTRAAPVFTAEIFESGMANNGVLNITGPSPVDTLEVSGVNVFARPGSYTGRAAADRGILSTRMAIELPNTFESLYTTLNSRAMFALDDVFITGPGGGPASVQATMHVRVDGEMSRVDNASGGASIQLFMANAGNFVAGDYYSSGLYGDHGNGLFAGESGTSIHGTFSMTNALSTVSPNYVAVSFIADAGAANNGGGGSASSDFFDGVHFPTAGPVFDLPEGYTANSVSGNIVDNHWMGVPEPSSALLALIAATGLAMLRFRRRVKH